MDFEHIGGLKNTSLYLVAANFLVDKTLTGGIPIWMISWDLSKALDRIDVQSLWKALRCHRVSDHLVWLIYLLGPQSCFQK